MADAGTQPKRYRAFISYSQKDKPEARKLQAWLETYRAPKTAAANAGPSRRLGKFFRDEEDLSGAADLGETLKHSIDASESLIVLCSPNAAKSPWVDREIQHFRRTGRGGKVFAVILSGDPNAADPSLECFPPSFRTSGASHDPATMPLEPLAVNLAADGRERASTRLAAALLEAPFDELWRRERRRQQRRAVFAGGLFVIGAGLRVAAVVAGWFAVANFNEAEARGAEAERQGKLAATNLAEADRQSLLAAHNLSEAERQGDLAAANLTEAGHQSALASTRNSNIFAREAEAISATGDHATALLMALQADPAAQRSAVSRKFDGANGYALARAQLSAAHTHNRLTRILGGHEGAVLSAAFSPDGMQVATALFDGTALIGKIPAILLAGPKEQVRIACEILRRANAPLALTAEDAQKYPVLQGEPVDPEAGDLVSPCKGVLGE